MNKEVNYLKEHLYEIYKYKKSMKDLTYDMNIELLLRICKALDKQQQQIDKTLQLLYLAQESGLISISTTIKALKGEE